MSCVVINLLKGKLTDQFYFKSAILERKSTKKQAVVFPRNFAKNLEKRPLV
ncbi:hypothetical protein CYK57_00675 [Actinobacillus pleuropneumoniae]|nr:hypothetical protein CYK57_00675 [Actinobacillus pleuropneumoniae]